MGLRKPHFLMSEYSVPLRDVNPCSDDSPILHISLYPNTEWKRDIHINMKGSNPLKMMMVNEGNEF